jgi:hypothetical protein
LAEMEVTLRNFNVILLLAIALFCFLRIPPVMAQEKDPVELTQSDLFSLPNWRHRTVAIDGFVPGISRAQALEIAAAKNLRLAPTGPGLTIRELRGPCTQARCSVGSGHGNWVGIDLFFDAEKVTKIEVGLSVDMDPEVKKVNVAQRFKGLTYQFFNHYSDSLREKILGSADGKRDNSMPRDTDHITYVEYDYAHSGVVVHVTKGDEEPLDLSVDFFAPQ